MSTLEKRPPERRTKKSMSIRCTVKSHIISHPLVTRFVLNLSALFLFFWPLTKGFYLYLCVLTVVLPQPWPIVEQFLKELPPGAIGLDIGCGNGKYLTVNPDIFIIASDR